MVRIENVTCHLVERQLIKLTVLGGGGGAGGGGGGAGGGGGVSAGSMVYLWL